MGKSKIVIQDSDALLVIDAQPTFMPGGGLPVTDGDKIMPVVVDLMKHFRHDRRFATRDWHPRGHISLASSYMDVPPMTVLTESMVFDRKNWSAKKIAPHALFTQRDLEHYIDSVGGSQVLWPDHAIIGTDEAALHPAIREDQFAFVLQKGSHPLRDSYSAFQDNLRCTTGLRYVLQDSGIERIFMAGLALDYCVGWSATDARDPRVPPDMQFDVFVVEDATRAVGFPPDSVEKILLDFEECGVQLVNSEDIIS